MSFAERVLPQIFDENDLMLPGDFRKEKYEVKIGDKTRDFDVADRIF